MEIQKKNTRTDENNAPKMLAEVMIPAKELRRLRNVGISIDKKLKVGKPGITEGIVNGIHERWRRSELVKIKCEDLCRMNMKRTHEILEVSSLFNSTLVISFKHFCFVFNYQILLQM